MANYIVGLTGGIGSGKTAVSDAFAALGVTVVDADVVSREVVEPGRPALAAIVKHFGADITTADGHLDRAALRQVIFADASEKQWLEQLLHPLIGEETLHQLAAADSPYALLVSPLLTETGQQQLCQRVLVVDAPEALQLQRTMTRDNNSREQVERIIASQSSRQQRLASADDVLNNDGDLAELREKVAQLHQTYLQLAAQTHD